MGPYGHPSRPATLDVPPSSLHPIRTDVGRDSFTVVGKYLFGRSGHVSRPGHSVKRDPLVKVHCLLRRDGESAL